MVDLQTIGVLMTGVSVTVAAIYYMFTLRINQRNIKTTLETRQADILQRHAQIGTTQDFMDAWCDVVMKQNYLTYEEWGRCYGPGPNARANKKTQREITGNTLRAYLYLITHGPSELREVQRSLGLSTPSLASYHLSRLMEAGYVKQDEEGRYLAIKEASTEILQGYSRVGNTLVPQLFFFTVLFTILIVFFSIESLYSSDFILYLVGSSIALVALLWYESFRLWRRLVVESPKNSPSP